MLAKHHSYSSDSSSRELIHVYLAVISTGLAYGLYLVCEKYKITIPWWIEAPSIFGFYGLIFGLFRIWFWNKGFFKFIFQLKTPDWNGVYKGHLFTSHDGFSQPIQFELKIEQNWNRIIIIGKTATSTSNSFLGFFSDEETHTPFFIYQYMNQPKIDANSNMNIHKGVAELHFEDNQLFGEFFNGRGRNTTGRFAVKKTS